MAAAPLLLGEVASAEDSRVVEAPSDLFDSELVSVSGTLVSSSPEEIVLKDGDGNEHHLRVTELTRYVWTESTSPRDFRPGARIRADYSSSSQQQLLHSIWVLERS